MKICSSVQLELPCNKGARTVGLCRNEPVPRLACRGRPSLRGSVPETESLRSGPLIATPQRCSVAYCTITVWCGKLGRHSPAAQLAHREVSQRHESPVPIVTSARPLMLAEAVRGIAHRMRHTSEICAEYGPHVLKSAVCPPAGDNVSGWVQSCKVALESNVAWLHLNSSAHALKGTTASVVPALTLHCLARCSKL